MPADTRQKLIVWVAKGFGLGCLTPASGSWGSLGGVVLGIVLSSLPFETAAGCLIVISAGAIWIADKAAQHLGTYDPGCVVIDEIVGMGFAMAGHTTGLFNLIGIFLLFRALDIFKPFPIKYLEKLKGGFGIVMDDVAAGIAANLLWRLTDVMALR